MREWSTKSHWVRSRRGKRAITMCGLLVKHHKQRGREWWVTVPHGSRTVVVDPDRQPTCGSCVRAS